MLDLLAIVADTLAIKKNQLPSWMIKNNPKNEQLNPGRFLDWRYCGAGDGDVDVGDDDDSWQRRTINNMFSLEPRGALSRNGVFEATTSCAHF